MKQRLFSKAGLLVLALLTLLLTIGIQQLFKGARLDLTEDKLYTLSDGTHSLLSELASKATITLFYSDGQTKDLPFIRNYARRVQELLEEYVAASKGNLTLKVIDPEPFSANEDKASEYGLQAVPLGNGSKEIYFGLVITRDDDPGKKEVISFLHPDKERFLEYDISKLVFAVTQTEKPRLGIISGLQVRGGFDMMSRQSTGPWISVSQLEQLYDVTTIEADKKVIPEGLKLLIIIHPADLSEQMRYSIDQFVLAGGHALVFVDPDAESASQGGGMMMGGGGAPRSSTLEPLFKAWGIAMDTRKVVADAEHALSVGSPSGRPVRHLGILGFGEKDFNKDDVVTSSLRSVNFATAGAIQKLEGGTTRVESLLHTGKKAMLMDADKFTMMSDPGSLYRDFKPTGEQYMLIARITGDVKTAYPDGYPKEEAEQGAEQQEEHGAINGKASESEKVVKTKENGKDKENKDKEKKEDKPKAPQLMASTKPLNVIVVADTDVLTDRLWVQKTRFFGQQVIQPFAGNGDMLINMVDNLLGNASLISIHSRGQFSRPFDKVNELEQTAEASFHKKEDMLKQELSETEKKLRELQRKKQGEEKLVLSPEQEQEVEKFMQEKLKIRKELRNVQHQLGKDIDNLGTVLKLINIFAVPLLITLLVLGWRFTCRRKNNQ